ncbi:YceI family protein (plasmid) [Pedobacter sp. BS3]|uniref:YceI family protein n=1 Tax=Pedobacter sp. BS3 TaxID=2567937 RepID=UPI0011EBBA91|nr:YceI family protein [Pedobacter sp. BS3]TZF85873.1 YceI family protein [Pedobacter sp. BS3]
MKRLRVLIGFVAIAGLAAFTNKSADEKFTVDTDKSSVSWIGRKVTGQHHGTIKLASGSLTASGNNLKTGNFTLDMNSITNADLEGEYAQKLLGHLKSDDFFSVAKNPVSTFVITKVTPAGANQVNITGNLTIKGITNPISFLATVKRQGNVITATAPTIKVDRTKYDIRYGSKSFFASIGDKAIDDEFELAVNLLAKK